MLKMREIAEPLASAAPENPGHLIYKRFEAEPDTLAIAVVGEDGRPVGLIERDAFSLKIASPYGRSLYADRPITMLMNAQPLMVEAETSIADFTGRVLQSRASDLMRGFIVVSGGRYFGVGSALALMQAVAGLNLRLAETMTAQARDLAKAEAEAQNREASFRLLFESNPVAMCLWDQDSMRILGVNEAALTQYGYDREALLGLSVPDLLAEDERDRLARLRTFGRLREENAESWRHRRGDGSQIEVQPMVRALTYEGRPARLAALFDVTARVRDAELLAQARDAAEAANLAKSEFLANMSHEIRTPLNGILGIAGVLARGNLDQRQLEMVRIVESSADALNALLSDLLDYARIEAKGLTLSQEPFQLRETVRAVADIFRLNAQQKGLALELSVEPETPDALIGDAARLRQILINLLSNAVKFTDRGSVRLSITTTDDAQLLFEVADTGIGFPMDRKDALFGRFEQADGSITRRFGGSGLGLAISRSLAELMQGKLDAVSEPGAGSVFTLRIPLNAAGSSARAGAPEPGSLFERKLRVLAADDHPTNRRVVELVLASAGADIVCVGDGAEAVDAFVTGGFDLILMDMQMPVMDGLSAIREIRAHERELGIGRTPILALTANAMAEHAEASLAAGADGHVAKPIRPSDLIAQIGRVLGGSRELQRACA